MIGNSDIGCNKPIIECCNMSIKLQGIPENIFSADEFIGNKVVDREGIQYGKVKHIHINPDTLIISGVTIHEGFRSPAFQTHFLGQSLSCKIPKNHLLVKAQP